MGDVLQFADAVLRLPAVAANVRDQFREQQIDFHKRLVAENQGAVTEIWRVIDGRRTNNQ
jgi:hypothetical protein